MSHFAQIDENNVVVQVLVADQEFVDSQPGTWVQTSYNTRGGVHYAPDSNTPDGGVAIRKNYAGVGYTYVDGVGFHEPRPYPSWTLNSDTYIWEPPSKYPDDGRRYYWIESKEAWIEDSHGR
jgi:hypothetical protein